MGARGTTCADGRPLPPSLPRAVVLAVLSGLLLILAFPRFDLHPLAWIALVPLLLALEGRGATGALALSWLTGVISIKGVFYWINSDQGVTWTEAVFLNLYLGAYVGLFGLAHSFVRRRVLLPAAITTPVLWVSLEYLRSNAGFLALPWALLGHSQYENLRLVQLSSLTGVYGISFLIAMVNGAAADLVLWWRARHAGELRPPLPLLAPATVTILLVGLSLVYGSSVISAATAREALSVTVVQGNIPQRERWRREFQTRNLERHERLSRQARMNGHTALIAWPEAAIAGVLIEDPRLSGRLARLASDTGSYLLVGSAARPKFGPAEFRARNYFNSAFLFSPAGSLVGRYDKIHLLPFGEYLPYPERVPWPARLGKITQFVAGKEYVTFDLHGVRLAVLICWESAFPDIARQFVRNGANLIVNITNEAWFGDTAAPYQFLAMSVFRAAENRVALARAANTGISGFVDPYGRIVGAIRNGGRETFVEGVATAAIPISRGRTFYTIHGDVFAHLTVALALGVVGTAALRPRATPAGAARAPLP